jgi:dTDP-4-amino-4,6-dideoxygalactose transaminase
VHYPVPLHRQPAFSPLPSAGLAFPVSEKVCDTVFSLPMHPFLTRDEIEEITRTMSASLR